MMPPEIAKLGHVALVTPSLEDSVWFFRDVIGLREVEREGDTVFLRGLRDWEHHTLSLTEGDRAALDHVGWRTRSAEDVDAFADRLTEEGIDVTRLEPGEETGQGKAVRFRIPAGHQFELYFDTDKPEPTDERRSRLKNRVHNLADASPSIPRRIDHVNVHGPDVTATHEWLQEVLGFRMNEYALDDEGDRRGGWMSNNSLVHTLAYGTEKGANEATFHHVAFYLDSFGDLMNAADVAREHGVDVEGGPGKHGITQANFLYITDPATGIRVELYNGGYQIFDPDWEAIEWDADEAAEGLTWFGNPPNQETIPVE